jgi:hypothetical protein
MKIDEKRKAAILGSLLKPEKAHAKNIHEADSISKSKDLTNSDTIDKLELSAQKSTIDRSQEKPGKLPLLLKEQKKPDFIDKVELSTKKKPHVLVKEKEKTTSSIISQDRINALLEMLKSETYNMRLEGTSKSMMKSQLLEIVI